MSQQLKKWLSTLDRVEAKFNQVPDFRQYGKLTRATGLVMEAVGLKLPIGALCIVERRTEQGIIPVESEVVGFNGQTLFLMPLSMSTASCPGRAFTLCKATATPVNNCPLVHTCWAGCWMRRGVRSMADLRQVNQLQNFLRLRLIRCTVTRSKTFLTLACAPSTPC